jgi:hydrogenase/urease accessory protein HupE
MRALLLSFFVLSLGAGTASAHESRPLYIEVAERAPKVFSVKWRVPPTVPAFNRPDIVLPDGCQALGPDGQAGGLAGGRLYECQDGLAGRDIDIRYPAFNPSVSTLLRVYLLSGETHSAVLSPKETSWSVPERETATAVAREYLVLGIRHILGGYDHLLFVACLILIARSWRRILITVTGFTLGHSVTLALAALDLVRVPISAVEAGIALSVLFLTVEIARDRRDTLTYRVPVVVATSFGLLHGFGFAAVLGEIGLPQTEIPAALLFFNLGVEIGQILFVALFLSGRALLRAAAAATAQRVRSSRLNLGTFERSAVYAFGSLAAFWTIERVASLWA